MGKITQGILGPFSGKCGGIVGGSWKGIATIKGYQPQVSNPKTAAQIANRDKLAFVVAFARAILSTVIKPLWDRFQSGMSGYNAFVSQNKALFTSAVPSSFDNLVISSGKMAPTVATGFTASAATGVVEASWNDDSGQGFKLATDKAYITVCNSDASVVEGGVANNARGDEAGEITVQGTLIQGEVLNCYLSFLRSDGSIVSNSSYTTCLIGA